MLSTFTSPMDKAKAAQIFFTLYWKYPELLARDYMRNAKLLEQWLQVEYERDVQEIVKFPEVEAPDVCAVCKSVIGFTVGGRIREGCFNCKHAWEAGRGCLDSYFRHQLAKITGYSYAEVTIWLASCAVIDKEFWDVRLPPMGF